MKIKETEKYNSIKIDFKISVNISYLLQLKLLIRISVSLLNCEDGRRISDGLTHNRKLSSSF